MKNIKLKDAIKKINFDDKKIQDDVDWEDLANALNINNGWDCWFEQERLKVYFIEKWYCTDSYVGRRAYFLDGEFVALSYQGGRKSNEDFDFVSLDLAKKVKEYFESLIQYDEEEFTVSLLDLEEEISDFYHIEYNSQIMHKHAYYLGDEIENTNLFSENHDTNKDFCKVEIIKKHYQSGTPNYFHTVEIKGVNNKNSFTVDCRNLLFSRWSLD
jgi:hypothetical protein